MLTIFLLKFLVRRSAVQTLILFHFALIRRKYESITIMYVKEVADNWDSSLLLLNLIYA